MLVMEVMDHMVHLPFSIKYQFGPNLLQIFNHLLVIFHHHLLSMA
jgi:hypothetical protein